MDLVVANVEKMAYTSHIQPPEPRLFRIMLNKNTVMPCRPMPPGIYCSNTFTKHPPSARKVAWSIINGNRWGKNPDLGCGCKDRTVSKWNIIELNICVGMYQLFIEKASNKVWKVRDIEMNPESFNRERKIPNCSSAYSQ
jgi:hypothetical protein